MTKKQKIAISIGAGIVAAYAVIFVYQRIQRANADKKVVSEDEALKILGEKSFTDEPTFSEEDIMPQLPDEEVVSNTPSEDLMQFEIETGYGDY